MCSGGGTGLEASQFRFTELPTAVGGDEKVFNGKNQLFANRYVEITGAITLQITKVKNGGTYVIRVTKNTANDAEITLPAGSIVANAGGGSIILTGAINSKHIISFIYDGTNYYFAYAEEYT